MVWKTLYAMRQWSNFPYPQSPGHRPTHAYLKLEKKIYRKFPTSGFFNFSNFLQNVMSVYKNNLVLRANNIYSPAWNLMWGDGGVSDRKILHFYKKYASFMTQQLYVTLSENAGNGLISFIKFKYFLAVTHRSKLIRIFGRCDLRLKW